jgi:ribonuclease-3
MNRERRDQLLSFLAALGLTPPDPNGSLAVLDEALTHTSAGLAFNHERLEFLGDAVLRLAASEFLERHYPRLRVGQSSALRAQLVSDRWLAELGERCGIEAVLRIGATAAGDQAGRATLRAEACEAVIGALYQLWGNLEPVHHWLTPHWQRDAAELEADPNRHNWKSALQEWSQAGRRGLPHYSCEEVSQIHADPRRFHCRVRLGEELLGEGWGGGRRQAEQEAARAALERLRPARGS